MNIQDIDIEKALAPIHRAALSNDSSYCGFNKSLNASVTMYNSESTVLTQKAQRHLMKLGYTVTGYWKCRYSIQSFNSSKKHCTKMSFDQICTDILSVGRETYTLVMRLEFNGHAPVYIALSTLLSSHLVLHNSVKILARMDGSEPERIVMQRVESIIDEARKRVLGDKYSPEIMYTSLV